MLTDLDKILYHYSSHKKAMEIESSGIILPSIRYSYLSVNFEGKFDEEFPTGPKGAGWISGRSKIPNIFLTDTPPSLIETVSFGSNREKDCAFVTTVREILEQKLLLYPNPSKEYPNIYNIPCRGYDLGLKVDLQKVILLK